MTPMSIARRRSREPRGWRRLPRSVLAVLGATMLAGIFAGCEPAQSKDGGNDSMIFGLFKKKFATTVNPAVGVALVRESTYPGSIVKEPASAYPQVRLVGASAAPPGGVLAKTTSEEPPAEAYVADAWGGQPPIAVVNTYEPARLSQVWQLDARDPTHFAKPRAAFAPEQPKWLMASTAAVIALPAHQLLIQLRYHKPRSIDGVFVYDAVADRMRNLGDVEPDWAQGIPYRYVDSLQVLPEAVLVIWHTENERLGPQRYVNHFDHLMLFSPRHREGIEILTLGIDDGNVRRWGMVGSKLFMQTSDDRGAAPQQFVWSLDLGRVL